jgi:HSP20 family protein
MVDSKNLASYLKKYREQAEITQGELAEKLSVSRQSVISLESGKCVPSVMLALKISRFFELPVEYIFRVEEQNLDSIFDQIENKLKGGEEDMPRDLMPWSPWREMMSMRENVDKFFDEPFSSRSVAQGNFQPSVGIRETEKELVVEADLPGVKDEDVDVQIEDDKLIIRGERKHSSEIKKEDYYHMESSYGAFSRTIGLPSYVDPSRAEAEVKDGILEVKLPKVQEKKSKKIQVKKKTVSK